PTAIQKKALKGETGYLERPGALLPEADLDAARKTVEAAIEREVTEAELSSYLMYPKVFVDFAHAEEQYGPVSRLPTPAYFYGLDVGDELQVDLEPGVTLVIDNLAQSDPDDDGMVTVFFELNGQPRRIKVPDRSHG
ncbi:MAG: pyruvate carboxylase, partial [Alphaproteobacteria bacterium]